MKRTLTSLIAILTLLPTLVRAGQSTERVIHADLIEGQVSARNYVPNSNAEQNIQGWSAYADAAGATPVDGTGGSPTLTIARSTSSPLSGKASFLLTKDAADRQGEGASYDFSLDAVHSTNQPQNMVIEFYYTTGGTFAFGSSSDVQVYVYDVTNATLITPASVTIGGSAGRFQTTFLPSSSSTSYRLIFHVATTSASAWTLKIDRVSVHELPTTYSSASASSVAVLTTGNGFGSTNTNIRRYSSRTTQGSALTCTDDAALGSYCTVNEGGIYAINRIDRNTGAAANFGVSKNDDCTSGGFDSVASDDQLAYTMAPSNVAVNAPNGGSVLVSGDVLRACDDSAAKTNDTTSRTSRLVIAKVRDEPLPQSFITATGGTITTDGNYRVHTFSSSGTFQITSGSGTVESLVVGGGGGGGGGNGYRGAGGGAGEFVHTTPGATYGAGSYTVTVGAGGAGGTAGSGTNGSSSAFAAISAIGGGGGGSTGTIDGNNGGSGGGGSSDGVTPGAGGSAATGGNAGGAGVTSMATGGGGGAGAVGSDASGVAGGNGGDGLSSTISGSLVTYAGGGGGIRSGAAADGTGGTGGGGDGNYGVAGSDGTANTGGGGGGSNTAAGGAGGSGVVVLRYQFQ